ncbi:16S rRNA processing protein RimM [Dysgonomonas alginatilytica]|uniref:Ribosome maturation factor RimM n=1 Tax=Dysgonomonas alginatilytica TaxID=1605892 RepID=A0A2V3PNK3_9BACT|nr:ribosome maturation factor RimM [Dysgonomonas alginatilytica]PXV64367.1 16S rRNA processing protein RimM [Dysgonomonas alginatilytica]
MIREDEVLKIGKFIKPHGIKGEITFAFDNDIFDRVDCPYLICSVDNILVPFFVKSRRFKGSDTALILFEDINSEIEAKHFNGLSVYFPRKYFDENEEVEFTLNYFIDFIVIDKELGEIGTISDVDESTINTLFLLKKKGNGDDIIIPASDDFITDIDSEKKILYVDLPAGLIDIE